MQSYTYSIIDDFPNSIVDTTILSKEILDSAITIAVSYIETSNNNCYITFKVPISSEEETTLDGIVSSHEGVSIADNLGSIDNKIWTHQTPRPPDTFTAFTSAFDDVTDNANIFGGEIAAIEREVGGSDIVKYYELNTMDNSTYVHSCLIQKKDCDNDIIKVEIVPRLSVVKTPGIYETEFNGVGLDDCTSSGTFLGSVRKQFMVEIDSVDTTDTFKWSNDNGSTWQVVNENITGSSQLLEEGVQITCNNITGHTLGDKWSFWAIPSTTNYKLYNNVYVMPSTFPAGETVDLITDWENSNVSGLIFIPMNEKRIRPLCYWDATYNPTTKKYENLEPKPSGDGRFNMFSQEITLFNFIPRISLLGCGDLKLQSHDREKIGQGFRFKVTPITNGDHAWKCSLIVELFRKKLC